MGQFQKPGQQRPPQAPGAPKLVEGQVCKQCNRLNYGKCMWGTFRCFVCKKEGHKETDCPQNKGPTTGRAYVMQAEEAEAEPYSTLITGIIPVAMDSRFRVSISSRDQMFTSQIVKGLVLQLQKYTVQADLIVLPLPEFDVILGMDWLSLNRAVKDF
ncbi:uncharacterized protein [Primulina huaijiensis]|uniref:uncharacterized protein n=1 Tax=Primulina huaijiensis TaxID=1492673 RepID=UPI003CC76892